MAVAWLEKGQGFPANGKKSLEATENFVLPRRVSAVTVSAWIGNDIGLSSLWFRSGFLGQLCIFLMLLAVLALRLGDLNPLPFIRFVVVGGLNT